MKPTRTRFFGLMVAALLSATAHAQTYDLSWNVIAGGGGTSTNGGYSLSGTIGQPAAGVMSSGSYTLSGGFWGLYSVVQTPNSPLLAIAPSGSSVILSWPAPSTGFFLQQNVAVNNSNGWSNVSQATNVVGSTNTVTFPVSGARMFFRLVNP